MKDPYLYDDVEVLINRAGIKDAELLRHAEADISNIAMTAIYERSYDKFDVDTLCDIHKMIFGQIYDWAGEFRSIQMVKYEDILGGDTVIYTHPKNIKKELKEVVREIKKLKKAGNNDKDNIFKLVRIIAAIWQIHPFREGNTRTVIVFSVLLAKYLGYEVNYTLFKENSSYVRNALVWASQGMYSKHEYIEKIFYDALFVEEIKRAREGESKYEKIGDYKVKDYVERPHKYQD